MVKLYRLGGLLAALLLGASVYADDFQIERAWVRATAPGRDSANVYMFITSKPAGTLVGASSPASKAADLRTMTHKNGMMKTIVVKSINLPANSRTDMSSEHGYHVTLVDLKAPLKAGEAVPLTLNVEMADKRSVRIDVQAEVRPLKTATQP